jgi:hypothetical protein
MPFWRYFQGGLADSRGDHHTAGPPALWRRGLVAGLPYRKNRTCAADDPTSYRDGGDADSAQCTRRDGSGGLWLPVKARHVLKVSYRERRVGEDFRLEKGFPFMTGCGTVDDDHSHDESYEHRLEHDHPS